LKPLNRWESAARKLIRLLESDPEKTGVVIFGRSYNGFVKEAHMGIPDKLASRGVLVIPFDFLPFDNEIKKPTWVFPTNWHQGVFS